MNARTTTALCGLLAAAGIAFSLLVSAPAEAQRYRDTGSYGYRRGPGESIRRLVDRAESTSNAFRDAVERDDRFRDSVENSRYGQGDRYYRGNRYGGDVGRYDRDSRYSRDGRYPRENGYYRPDGNASRWGAVDYSRLKEHVQRLDEGLERLRGQAGYNERSGDSRSLMNEIMVHARFIDGSLRRGGGSNSRAYDMWAQLRSDLNVLASAYGTQRI